MTEAIHLSLGDDGVLLLTLDRREKSMNTIDQVFMDELSAAIDRIQGDAAVKGAVITSGKPAFLAGGDLFEIEDQRNWTDASFKTYCTPLAVPFPRRIESGQRVCQRVAVSVDADTNRPTRPARSSSGEGRQLLLEPSVGTVPPIGVTVTRSAGAEDVAAELAPGLVRLVLSLDALDEDDVANAHALAEAARAPLDIALMIPRGSESSLPRLASLAGLPSNNVVVLQNHADVTDPALVRAVSALWPRLRTGGGTDRHFVDLNRNRPPADWSVVGWPLNPQAHASDERSIIQTADVHSDLVRTARSFAPRANLTAWAQLVPGVAADGREATMLAAVFAVGGPSLYSPRLLVAVLGAVTVVPAYLLTPVIVDKSNWKEVLVDSGYYKADQFK